jgi:hypothetical protein
MTCESNTNEIVVLMPSNKCCLSLTASFSLFVSPPAEAVSRPDEETATAWPAAVTADAAAVAAALRGQRTELCRTGRHPPAEAGVETPDVV